MNNLRPIVILALGMIAIGCQKAFPGEPSDAGRLTVASLMYQPVKWDKEANRKGLDIAIRKAHADGAQLIVTPEGALEGYVVNEVRNTPMERGRKKMVDRFNKLAEPIDGPYVRYFQKLCKELKVFLVIGFLEADKEETFNTAVVISPDGKILGKYRKTHFAQGYKVGDRKGNNPVGYTRGKDYPVFHIAGQKLGVMICFDRRVPKVAKSLATAGATLIVNPAYGMKGNVNRKYISARAKENQVPVLFVHPNQTVFAKADGDILVDDRPKKHDPRIRLVTIDLPKVNKNH